MVTVFCPAEFDLKDLKGWGKVYMWCRVCDQKHMIKFYLSNKPILAKNAMILPRVMDQFTREHEHAKAV